MFFTNSIKKVKKHCSNGAQIAAQIEGKKKIKKKNNDTIMVADNVIHSKKIKVQMKAQRPLTQFGSEKKSLRCGQALGDDDDELAKL